MIDKILISGQKSSRPCGRRDFKYEKGNARIYRALPFRLSKKIKKPKGYAAGKVCKGAGPEAPFALSEQYASG
jgi:hypothetical protein